YDGEFINQETIIEDFFEITCQLYFTELSIIDDNMDDIINNIYEILLTIDIMNYLLINRSNETFIIFKLSDDDYLIIDSHQTYHGIVDNEKLIKYITKYHKYRGNIQLGWIV